VSVRDAQNEDYYRRTMTGADILGRFGHDAGEMARRHEEIFRLHSALLDAEAGSSGVQRSGARSNSARMNSAEMRGTPF